MSSICNNRCEILWRTSNVANRWRPGCGRIGRMHAANVAAHPRAKLASVYDTHRPFAEEVAARSGITAADLADAIFASGDIDAVLVATATDTHADYIERAVAAGKPVLCEKPIDLSSRGSMPALRRSRVQCRSPARLQSPFRSGPPGRPMMPFGPGKSVICIRWSSRPAILACLPAPTTRRRAAFSVT